MAPNAEDDEHNGQYYTVVNTSNPIIGQDIIRFAQDQPDFIKSSVEDPEDFEGQDYIVFFETAHGLQAVFDHIEAQHAALIEDDGYYFDPGNED